MVGAVETVVFAEVNGWLVNIGVPSGPRRGFYQPVVSTVQRMRSLHEATFMRICRGTPQNPLLGNR